MIFHNVYANTEISFPINGTIQIYNSICNVYENNADDNDNNDHNKNDDDNNEDDDTEYTNVHLILSELW